MTAFEILMLDNQLSVGISQELVGHSELVYQREWDGWAHKSGLTHCSPGPSVVLCALSIAIMLC